VTDKDKQIMLFECSALTDTEVAETCKKIESGECVRCVTCGKYKKITECVKRKVENGRYIYYQCKKCKWKMKIKSSYGLTARQYVTMYKKQNGKCGICRGEIQIRGYYTHIDHCHKTNKVRALLCGKCNTGIGQFNDDPEILEKARDYVALHGPDGNFYKIMAELRKQSRNIDEMTIRVFPNNEGE
jgi:hypothetical protein